MTTDPLANVSRETREAFDHFEAMVRKWTPKINLVASSTLPTFQDRHIADSVALSSLNLGPDPWVDLGSGGGFPGIVVAILQGHQRAVTLVESDQRKCAFLRAVKRELNLVCTIITGRIEEVAPQHAAVVSARALAPLPELLGLATRHVHPDGELLLSKGANWRREDVAARLNWSYDLDIIENATQIDSVVLRIKNARRIES